MDEADVLGDRIGIMA
jgi:ATP-binding cassette subfamily A (ABC1) protein 3